MDAAKELEILKHKGREMRHAQKSYFNRQKKGDWVSADERDTAIRYCKAKEALFDEAIKTIPSTQTSLI